MHNIKKEVIKKCYECGGSVSRGSSGRCSKCYTRSLSGSGNAFYGKKHSVETREKMSDRWVYEKHITTSMREKISRHNKISGKTPPVLYGPDNWNWKGGLRPLEKKIREIPEYVMWRNTIFSRDNYTCIECGKTGVYIEAHHINPFSNIIGEFLKKYNQFSPIEDKETLVRLSVTHEPFWDIDNGKTLCCDCHNATKKSIQYT